MRLETGISPQYVKNWTVGMALREVVQNYLDVLQQTNCTGRIQWCDNRVEVSDDGPGLELRHLALGIGDKNEFNIGQFGEGLKLALLVLVREGRDPVVQSARWRIVPAISVSDFGCETLEFDVSPAYSDAGTTVECICSREELERAKSYFACFRSDIKPLVPDELSLPGGRVFVNKALVGHVDGALFSYHLYGADAQKVMNRDREVIDESRLKFAVNAIVSHLDNAEALSILIQELSATRLSWEATNLSPTPLPSVWEMWKSVWIECLGPEAIVTYPWCGLEKLRWAKYMEYTPVAMPYGWVSAMTTVGVSSVDDAIAAASQVEPVVIPRSDLAVDELRTLDRAIKIVEDHYRRPAKVLIAKRLVTGYNVEADGLRRGEAIYLRRGVLQSLRKTVFALLHEEVHAATGHRDCTEEFQDALLMIAVEEILAQECIQFEITHTE